MINKINMNFAFGLLANSKGFEWWRLVKQPRALGTLLFRVMCLVVGRLSPMWCTCLTTITKRIVSLAKKQGSKGCVKYLKVCYIITQQVAGGYRVNNLNTLGSRVSRTAAGLPRIINKCHRKGIMEGNSVIIRLYLTVFGLYRVLPAKGVVKLGTITGLSTYRQSVFFGHRTFIPWFWTKLLNYVLDRKGLNRKPGEKLATLQAVRDGLGYKAEGDAAPTLRPDRILPITSAGPLSSGSGYQAFGPDPLWLKYHDKALARQDYLKKWPDGEGFMLGLWRGLRTSEIPLKIKMAAAWKGLSPSSVGTLFFTVSHWLNSGLLPFLIEWVKLYDVRVVKDLFKVAYTVDFGRLEAWGQKGNLFGLGKLAFLEEAAGKVRVVALVDVVTQSIFKPLHDFIFSILSRLPMDGTFNQNGPIELISKLGAKDVYSYDLSAATDRLPLALQSALLGWLLGEKVGRWWEALLVGRYYNFSTRTAEKYGLKTTAVKYAAGQPMGAYSSWAMLALTHHFCVQLAASRVYGVTCPWFLMYALLGDDIIIADKAVAKAYLALMKELGVEIQVTKSLVSSNGTFEFAKRTVVRGIDATPVSLRGFLVGLRNISCFEAAVAKIPGIWSNKLAAIARALGFGYKALGRLQSVYGIRSRLQGLFVFLSRPGGLLDTGAFASWIYQDSPMSNGAPMTDESLQAIYDSLGSWAEDVLKRQVQARISSFNRGSGKGWLPTNLFPTRMLFDTYQKLVLRHVAADLKLRLTELEVLLLRWKGQTNITLDLFGELVKDLDIILGELKGLPKDARVARLTPEGKPPTTNIFGFWKRLRSLVRKD